MESCMLISALPYNPFVLLVRYLLPWSRWSSRLCQTRSCLARWWTRPTWNVSGQWHKTILLQCWVMRNSAAPSWSMPTCHPPRSTSSRWRYSARSPSSPSLHFSKGTKHLCFLFIHYYNISSSQCPTSSVLLHQLLISWTIAEKFFPEHQTCSKLHIHVSLVVQEIQSM